VINKAYVGVFQGQGGLLFSWGIPPLTDEIRKLGVEADSWAYGDYKLAEVKFLPLQHAGWKLAFIGYSLGDSTVTYLQTKIKCDLLICIAESALAQNYKVNHANTKRSVLFHSNFDALSSAGIGDGFDEVIELGEPHLLMDTDARMFATVREEIGNLLRG
jgi:hypothetical protein